MATTNHHRTPPSPPPLLPPGRILLTLVALATSTACFVADWNESHIYNPTWPGHAKFHNAQTMSTGLLLGLAALWYIYREPLRVVDDYNDNDANDADADDDADAAAKHPRTRARLARLRTAAALANLRVVVLLNGLYWITQLSAHWYPRVTAFDPVPGSARFGAHQDPHLQKKLDVAFFGVIGVGWWLERGRILRGEF